VSERAGEFRREHVAEGLADQGLCRGDRRVVGDVRPGMVDQDAPTQVYGEHLVFQRSDQRAKLLLTATQGVFGAGVLADVAHKPREQTPLAQPHLDDRHVEREGVPVLVLADHLAPATDDFLVAGLQVVGHVAVVLAAVRLWHEHADAAAHHLVRAIAEDARRRVVERLDDAPLVNGDDALSGSLDDSLQPRLVIAQRSLGQLLLGDVEQRDDHRVGIVLAGYEYRLGVD